jgi:hypothetical protein
MRAASPKRPAMPTACASIPRQRSGDAVRAAGDGLAGGHHEEADLALGRGDGLLLDHVADPLDAAVGEELARGQHRVQRRARARVVRHEGERRRQADRRAQHAQPVLEREAQRGQAGRLEEGPRLLERVIAGEAEALPALHRRLLRGRDGHLGRLRRVCADRLAAPRQIEHVTERHRLRPREQHRRRLPIAGVGRRVGEQPLQDPLHHVVLVDAPTPEQPVLPAHRRAHRRLELRQEPRHGGAELYRIARLRRDEELAGGSVEHARTA